MTVSCANYLMNATSTMVTFLQQFIGLVFRPLSTQNTLSWNYMTMWLLGMIDYIGGSKRLGGGREEITRVVARLPHDRLSPISKLWN